MSQYTYFGSFFSKDPLDPGHVVSLQQEQDNIVCLWVEKLELFSLFHALARNRSQLQTPRCWLQAALLLRLQAALLASPEKLIKQHVHKPTM
jgi:hypothetical protein